MYALNRVAETVRIEIPLVNKLIDYEKSFC